jgi:hypothetical protein
MSLKNNQYPRTIVETNNVLSNHKLDARQQKQKGKDGKPNHQNKIEKDKDKDDEDSTPLSFSQMEGKCYCCGKKGHRSPECYSKSKIPQAEWAINKSQQHAQLMKKNAEEKARNASANTASNTAPNEEGSVGWTGYHCSFMQSAMKNLILLDSDSTDTIFCNRKYVKNIRVSGEPLSIETNGGVIHSTLKCDIKHMQNVWFNESSMTNIIALKDMTKRFRVTMDSEKQLALLVHLPDKIVKFKQFSNGLYAMDPNDKESFEMKPMQLMNLVTENMKFLSKQQRKRARRAREFYVAMGTPTDDDLKALVQMNLITNNVVTTADINLATKTYGPDIGAMKGKTTRSKPTAVAG